MHLRTFSRAGLITAAFGLSSPLAASERSVQAALACRAEAAPGRVLCELTFVAKAGTRLTWVDALVTGSPEFARPLRARVTPERFAAAGAGERKLSLAFVATSAGRGQVTVKARSVVCRGPDERAQCWPEADDVVAEIRVGS
jgi:hypothetical protein